MKKFTQPIKYLASWYSLNKDGLVKDNLIDKAKHTVHIECKDVIFSSIIIEYISLKTKNALKKVYDMKMN